MSGSEPEVDDARGDFALGDTREGFQELVEGVEDYAIYLLDPSGSILSWNRGARKIKQYTREEVIGKNFAMFYPPEALATKVPERELEIAAAEGRFEDEGWRIRKDESRIWTSVVITALRSADGSLRGFVKITRDLTGKRAAEERLRESEERFRLLVEQVRDYAIFMLDPNGVIVSWNAGAERIKGYSAREIIGRHFSVFYSVEDQEEGKPARELREALRNGSVEDEGWRLRKDGTRFWGNVVITALFERDGKHRGFAKVTRDMTERRQVRELQDADRQKNEFLSLLAHELRNPLAPIRTALHVIAEPRTGAAGVARAQMIAERQVDHMSRLLDDLLDVSRASQGRMDLRREDLDLRAAVARTVDAVRPMLAAKSQSISVDLGPDPLPVLADPTRIEQIVMNLLSNAMKYTNEGGHLGVATRAGAGEVELVVRDDGVGIRPELLPRIFDLFVQGERRVDRSVGGVGVGLTLVKRLVQLHGGTVEAQSEGSGQGSTFIVRLPASEAAGARSEPEPPTPRAEGARSLRVLVVDDNVDAADSLMMVVDILGFSVRVAYDGPAALKVAAEFRPHLAFLDIGMPEMDGYEVARRLREVPEARAAFLVALTGWGESSDRQRSEDAGFGEHLVKPANPAELERILFERQRAIS